jgi:hypothetical protein
MQERALDCGLPGMKAAATGRHDANKKRDSINAAWKK